MSRRLVLAAFLALATLNACRDQDELLFVAASPPRAFTDAEEETLLGKAGIRARLVTVNREALPSAEDREEIALNLFPAQAEGDTMYGVVDAGRQPEPEEIVSRAVIDEVETQLGMRTWTGHLADDEESSVFITEHRGVVLMSIRSEEGFFDVKPHPANPNLYVIREIDEARIPECGVGTRDGVDQDEALPEEEEKGEDEGKAEEPAAAEDGSRIDVLGLYSPAARRAAGSQANIETLFGHAITRANKAYDNSGILTDLRLVSVAEAAGYRERATFSPMLRELRGTADGQLDNVHAERNRRAADVVALIVENDSIGGIAYTMATPSATFARSAFSVTARDYAYASITLAHEIGHNQGCCHHPGDNPDDPCDGAFSDSFGHRFRGNNDVRYRTVMAYRPGNRIEYFSNPNVLFRGVKTGVAGSRNNARTINETRRIVANFRQSP